MIALDLSKRSTGWAVWMGDDAAPHFGSWELGSEYTGRGQTYAKLHANLLDLRAVSKFEALYFEEPLNPNKLKGQTNIDTLRVLSGLAAHAESFGHAIGLRIVQGINIDSWRPSFIGRINSAEAKRKAKAAGKSATDSLKSLTVERCRQLGFNPRNTDEADAIGILDYCVSMRGVIPPWRTEEVLQPMLVGGARR
jgi:hypothetical protein